MTCAIRSPSSAATRLRTLAALSAAVLLAVASCPLAAQTPPAPPLTTPLPAGSPVAASVLAPYRSPLIALVQPAAGTAGASGGTGSVPQDRPVVVFRFAAGEPDDPLDVRSLLVAVDAVDRTVLFQTAPVGSSGQLFQAWGPLSDPVTIARGGFAVGLHRVTARVCSSRGACATTEAQVMAVPTAGVTRPVELLGSLATASDSTRTSTRQRVIRSIIGVTRKLLMP